jgi:hypothetical protein
MTSQSFILGKNFKVNLFCDFNIFELDDPQKQRYFTVLMQVFAEAGSNP